MFGEKKRFALDLMRAHYRPDRARVLDVGSGTGVITDEIRKLGYDLVALDVSAEAIRQLSNREIEGMWGTLRSSCASARHSSTSFSGRHS